MTGNAFTSTTSLGASTTQDYGTPREFLRAVEGLMGEPIGVDLAAHERNHVCPDYLGPGGLAEDSLGFPWHDLGDRLLWLNPPFNATRVWAEKCHVEVRKGARITMLAPANVGADWYWKHVAPCARVLCLRPRIAFVGAPLRVFNRAIPKGSMAIPHEIQDPNEAIAWARERWDLQGKVRAVRMPFPGALMLALYGMGAPSFERWAWETSRPAQAVAA